MILAASYLWAVTQGGVPWDPQIHLGSVIGDIIIASVLFEDMITKVGGGEQ